ncbi:hypothetical protein B0H13DRAFT_1880265 [Mycena leptocephala]|nr:hypothetical protein B0H13DRAFT_1880265 [Mycena leptocephala]
MCNDERILDIYRLSPDAWGSKKSPSIEGTVDTITESDQGIAEESSPIQPKFDVGRGMCRHGEREWERYCVMSTSSSGNQQLRCPKLYRQAGTKPGRQDRTGSRRMRHRACKSKHPSWLAEVIGSEIYAGSVGDNLTRCLTCLVSTASPSFLRGIGRERRGVEVEREESESDGGRAQKGMERRGRGRGVREGSTGGDGTAQAACDPDSLASGMPHDELELKRDLPHAYGLGAREFRVEVRANGIRSARGARWKTEEEDARKREERKGE